METPHSLEVHDLAVPIRLDVYLTHVWKDRFSRSQVKRFIQAANVAVNGKTAKPHHVIRNGDHIEVRGEPRSESPRYDGENIPLDIVYEDEHLLVVNKPAGMVVHPGAGCKSHTLVHALLYHTQNLSKLFGQDRPGVVHRLDKGTSGLLVVAKTDEAHRKLAEQFKRHTIDRTYAVVVKGVVQHDEGLCEEPIGRGRVLRKKMHVQPEGKHALTYFRVLRRFPHSTLLEVKLGTGRTHQVRVHMRHLGYPVLGDPTYGVLSAHISRPALHAKGLGFTHPVTGKKLKFESDLPEDMKELIRKLEA